MNQASFDPGGFYEFELSDGTVRTRGGSRVLMLSASSIAPLLASAVEHGDLTPVRKLGKELGDHVAESLGAPPGGRTTEDVLGHAAGIVALFGWGRLSMEQWGDAVAVRLEHAPSIDDRALGVAALLGGVFSRLADDEVACVPVAGDRFVLVDPEVAEEVWGWARSGEDLPRIVARLGMKEGA